MSHAFSAGASTWWVPASGLMRRMRPDSTRPGPTSTITYINPVVAVVLGVAILGESLGPGAIAGLLLILAGSWLSTEGRLPPGLRRPAVATP